MSLYTLRTRSDEDNQQILASSTGEIFFSRVPNGVFNLFTSFTSLEEFGRFHEVICLNKQSKAHWSAICASTHTTKSR